MKELTSVVQVLYRKSMSLVRFQDGRENYMTLNKLTIVTVEKIPVNEESEVPTISVTRD